MSKETLKSLARGYRSLGLSKSESKLAAQMEDAVRSVEESTQSLRMAAKSIGITDEAAKAFCDSGQMAYS